MEFEAAHTIHHPGPPVFDLIMNRIQELVPYMKGVESIQRESHEVRDGGEVHIVSQWQASQGTAPAIFRPFVSRDALSWTDDALWKPDQFLCDWSSTSKLSRYYTCSGTNRFGPHPDDPEHQTELRIRGNLVISPENLPLVPKRVGRKIAPKLESFMIKRVLVNFEAMTQAVERYFDERA